MEPSSGCSAGDSVFLGRKYIKALFHHTAQGLVRAIVGEDEYGPKCTCDEPRTYASPTVWQI